MRNLKEGKKLFLKIHEVHESGERHDNIGGDDDASVGEEEIRSSADYVI